MRSLSTADIQAVSGGTLIYFNLSDSIWATGVGSVIGAFASISTHKSTPKAIGIGAVLGALFQFVFVNTKP